LADAERCEVLAVARCRSFIRVEVVFHQGDPGDTLHLMLRIGRGRIEVLDVDAVSHLAR
jgi:hypothetical protein